MAHLTKHFALVASIALGLALTAGASPADARSVMGFSGHAANPAEATCFSEWFGTATQNCSGTRGLFIPITVDAAGYQYVTVSAYGATSANNVGCGTISIDKNATVFWGGTTTYLSTFGAPSDIVPPAAWVPASGSMFVYCSMDQGSRVHVVNTVW